jgi:hypothetical protein
MEFASPLPPGTKYLKYGPTPDNHSPHWYEVPSTVQGNTIESTVTDGGLGDDDLIANGTIVDQGGPAVPSNATAVPALSLTALGALLLCLVWLGMTAIARLGA